MSIGIDVVLAFVVRAEGCGARPRTARARIGAGNVGTNDYTVRVRGVDGAGRHVHLGHLRRPGEVQLGTRPTVHTITPESPCLAFGGAATDTVFLVLAGARPQLGALDEGRQRLVPPEALSDAGVELADTVGDVVGVHGVALIVVLSVHVDGETDLLEVGLAGGLARLLPRASEDREEDRRQNGNDGDHHQQFNQRESTASHANHLMATAQWRVGVTATSDNQILVQKS